MFQIGVRVEGNRRWVRRVPPRAIASPLPRSRAFSFDAPKWLLYPSSKIPPHIRQMFDCGGNSFRELYEYKAQISSHPFPSTPFSRKFPQAQETHFHRSKQTLQHMEAILIWNVRIRNAMRRLLQAWRRRKLTAANEEDVITMEKPVKEVVLVDWFSRRTYHFEAQSIFRDVCNRLKYHSWMIPKPLSPRNPYTNQGLTQGQIHSLIEQLRRHGFHHWILEGFRDVAYQREAFETVYQLPLAKCAFETMFADPTHIDTVDLFCDFIEGEYEHHNKNVNQTVLWAIQHEPHHSYVESWRALCQKYYRCYTLQRPNFNADFILEIHEEALQLIEAFPHGLQKLRRKQALAGFLE